MEKCDNSPHSHILKELEFESCWQQFVHIMMTGLRQARHRIWTGWGILIAKKVMIGSKMFVIYRLS